MANRRKARLRDSPARRSPAAASREAAVPSAGALLPSDVLQSASDELGETLRVIRVQALDAPADQRDELFAQIETIAKRQQKMMLRDLKMIDQDPAIVDAIEQLSTLTHQIAKVRREMTTAKEAVDGAIKVLGFVDEILAIVGKVGLMA